MNGRRCGQSPVIQFPCEELEIATSFVQCRAEPGLFHFEGAHFMLAADKGKYTDTQYAEGHNPNERRQSGDG